MRGEGVSQIKLIQQFAGEMVAGQVEQFVEVRKVEVVGEITQVLVPREVLRTLEVPRILTGCSGWG